MKKLVLVLVLLVGFLVSNSVAAPYSEIILHKIGGVVHSNFVGEIEDWGLSESPGIEVSDGWLFENWSIVETEKNNNTFLGILFFDSKTYNLAGLEIGKWDFCLTSNTPNPQAPVPEPATMFLLGSGLVALVGRKKVGVKA